MLKFLELVIDLRKKNYLNFSIWIEKMSIYVDKRTKFIYINFTYKGIRCRESLKLKANKQNLSFAKKIDNEIQGLISANKFNYEEYFPNSPKLKIFDITPTREKKIKFSTYAKKWIERKEKESLVENLKFSTYKNYLSGYYRIEKKLNFGIKILIILLQ